MTALALAVVAHLSLMYAPDATVPWIMAAGYGTALLSVVLVLKLLHLRLHKGEDQRPLIGPEIAARACDVLLFVGAGYSTHIEPGVIKLFGVLPLGWSCAIAALLLEYIGALGLARGLDCRHSWAWAGGSSRLVMLAVGSLSQAAVNLLRYRADNDASQMETFLLLILVFCLFDGVRSARSLAAASRSTAAPDTP